MAISDLSPDDLRTVNSILEDHIVAFESEDFSAGQYAQPEVAAAFRELLNHVKSLNPPHPRVHY